MLSFEEAKGALVQWSQACLPGIRSVEVEKIRGSVWRYRDFGGTFLLLKKSMGERWGRIDRAYHKGDEMPAVTDDVPLPPDARPLVPGLVVLIGVLSAAYPTVGALIVSRLPTNTIGWIFCGMGLLYVVQRFARAYADYALVENIALPGGST
jgi:hypothetical protein